MGFLFGHGGAYKKAERNWNRWEAAARAEYENQAGQGIQNTAYQQALGKERDLLRDSLKAAASTAAVTGATPAAQALAQQQAVEAIADSTAKMGSNISADRNNAMQNYLQASRDATAQKNNALIQEAQAQSQALSGLIKTGANLVGTLVKPVPGT